MKKIISRILIIFIIIVMVFEFFFSSNVSYALDISDNFINRLTSLAGGIVAYGIWFERIIALAISTVFNEILSVGFAGSCGVNWGSALGFATPYAIFFNKYKLFDVNFFDISGATGTIAELRNSVAEWFYIMRNIAAIILLCILIYVGIRMAISTVAEDKAKYKKMFWDWLCSLVLIFVLQYIAIFTIYANNAIVNSLQALYKGSDMDTALLKIAGSAILPIGLGSIVATFVYCMIVFQTIAFMITYMQRVLKVGFLLIISPLISITYSIDKMGDGKAQALNAWLKEFVYTILIQPFHCLIYMAFISVAVELISAGNILTSIANIFKADFNELANGVLVILCLKFINDGETAIRKIFNFQDDSSLTSLAAGVVVGAAVIKNAQKIGTTTVKSVNGMRNFSTKIKGNIGKDLKNLKGTPLGDTLSSLSNSKIGKAGKWVGNKASGAGKWVGDKKDKYMKWSKEKHEKWAQNANNPNKNKLITGAKTWIAKNSVPTAQNLKNALPGALGMMGAAMSYATGKSGVLDAVGVGGALQEGSEQYFSSTLGTMATRQKESSETHENAQLDLEVQKRNEAIKSASTNNTSDSKPKEEYSTDSAIQKVVKQYNEDEMSLEIEKSQKGAVHPDKLKEIEKRRKKLQDDGVLDAVKSRAELETTKGREAFKNKVREENAKHGSAYSTKELKTKADRLLEAILALKLQQKNDDTNTDSKMENTLTEDEVSSANKTMDTLKKTIDRSVIAGSGGSFDMSRLLQQMMGLDDENSDSYRDVMRAALEYREAIANNQSEAIYAEWEQLNGKRGSLAMAAHGIDINEKN